MTMITIHTRDLDQQQQNLDNARAEMDYLKQKFDKDMAKLQARASDFEQKITEYTNMHNIARTVLSDLPINGTVSVMYMEDQDSIACVFTGDIDSIVAHTGASKNTDGFWDTRINGYNVQFAVGRRPEVVSAYIDGIGGREKLLSTTSTTEDEFIPEDTVMEALDRADELDEGTFSRVVNKIRRATLDEHDPNQRKLYNFVDRFKKEFGIKTETRNAGYGYQQDGNVEVRNYRVYLDCGSEETKLFFIDGKAYKGLKPEYADRFTMNGASNYKSNHDMSDGEIQVEIGLDRIYFDLHVVMDATKAERSREKYNKRFAKAYELDDDM